MGGGEEGARASVGRENHGVDSRWGVPGGGVKREGAEREEKLLFGCSENVLDCFFRDCMAFAKLDCVRVGASVDEVDLLSSSEASRDFVGEGGRGTLLGVRVSHLMVLGNFGDAGGEKSKMERGCNS